MLVDDPYVEDGVDLCAMRSKNSLMQEILKSLSEQNKGCKDIVVPESQMSKLKHDLMLL